MKVTCNILALCTPAASRTGSYRKDHGKYHFMTSKISSIHQNGSTRVVPIIAVILPYCLKEYREENCFEVGIFKSEFKKKYVPRLNDSASMRRYIQQGYLCHLYIGVFDSTVVLS
jgi:hypothetical protein